MIRFVRPLEAVTVGFGYVAALTVIPLVLATAYEVFARYLFGSPTQWAFELGYMLMGAHFMLGGALALQRGSHVRIDFFYVRLSERSRAIIDAIIFIVLLLPCLLLVTIELWSYATESLASGERSGQSAWNPVIWPFRMVMALSLTLLVLQVVAELIKCWAVLTGRIANRPRAGGELI